MTRDGAERASRIPASTPSSNEVPPCRATGCARMASRASTWVLATRIWSAFGTFARDQHLNAAQLDYSFRPNCGVVEHPVLADPLLASGAATGFARSLSES